MPQLAFANSFWESYDVLERPVKAGVRKAMQKFQQLTVPELQADKGLHLESVEKARDPRMRTIRINDFWRGVVLAPDDGSDVFLLVNVVRHDDAYTWAAKRLYTTNSATRALEVRNVVAIEQLTPALEKAAAAADSLLFAKYSDTVLRELGIDDQVLRAVRTIRPRHRSGGRRLRTVHVVRGADLCLRQGPLRQLGRQHQQRVRAGGQLQLQCPQGAPGHLHPLTHRSRPTSTFLCGRLP